MQMQEGNVESSIFEAALRLHESLDPGEIVAHSIELLPGIVQAESWAVFLKASSPTAWSLFAQSTQPFCPSAIRRE